MVSLVFISCFTAVVLGDKCSTHSNVFHVRCWVGCI